MSQGGWGKTAAQTRRPNERFMISATKQEGSSDLGISLILHRTEMFVTSVDEKGPFNTTVLARGDKVLKINGKMIPKQIKTVKEAEAFLTAKAKINMFIQRPDPKRDRGYIWVMNNT